MNQEELIEFRKELHRMPELSGSENRTAEKIAGELRKCNPDRLIENVGGTGILAAFFCPDSTKAKNILIRAELDAIAVEEENDIDYKSVNEGVMHGCGHDGHMTILIGLAYHIMNNRPENVNVWLLFQPAEETGKGSEKVMNDERFREIDFNHAFALHNLPGYSEAEIVIREGVFACASTGVEIKFRGKSSHAAYPEQGVNPASSMAELIARTESELNDFRSKKASNKAVCTYIQLGKRAFGISPGKGKIGYTLRSPDDSQLQSAVKRLSDLADSISDEYSSKIVSERVEPFAATVNDRMGVEIVKKAAEKSDLVVQKTDKPFPWSEDFGAFGNACPVVLFGVGNGVKSRPLHSEHYDFNDNLIMPAVNLFSNIFKLYDEEYYSKHNLHNRK